jgi:hypothetical protein
LADSEVRALAKATSLRRPEFLERFCQSVDGWITLRMDTPACPFLNADARCAVNDIRPRQCRAWPFWQENLKRTTWEGPVSDCCPGIGQGPRHSAREVERIAGELEEFYGDDG